MNTNELEKQMKSLLGQQEYTPPDAGWEKMQQVLHPSSSSAKVLALLPLQKVAAAIALLLMLAGTGGYFLLKNNNVQPVQVISKQNTETNEHIDASIPTKEANESNNTQEVFIAKNVPPKKETIIPVTPPSTVKDSAVNVITDPIQEPAIASKQTENNGKYSGDLRKPDDLPKHSDNSGNVPYYVTDEHKPGLNFGVAANIGKPSQGNIQYNIGVVARKSISERIFAEANVSLASTQVSYSERLTVPGGIGNAAEGFIRTADANYASNIISVGFAPSIGVKATKDLSFSVGGDIYKSLNKDIVLEQNDALDKLTEAADVAMPANKNVANWDAGIRMQADYKLGKKFSLSTQYRQGLTQYILIDGKSIKNSTFNIGFKYYINK